MIRQRSRGLGAVVEYYAMPDEETQRLIAARGDTIKIVPRPGAKTSPAAGPSGSYTFQAQPTSQMFWQPSPVQMNPKQFATAETAERIAQMVGGSVVQTELVGGSVSPWYDVARQDTPEKVNAGLVADLFAKYGENNPLVWEIINRDFGYYKSPADVPPVVAMINPEHLRVGPAEQPYVQPPAPLISSQTTTAVAPAAAPAVVTGSTTSEPNPTRTVTIDDPRALPPALTPQADHPGYQIVGKTEPWCVGNLGCETVTLPADAPAASAGFDLSNLVGPSAAGWLKTVPWYVWAAAGFLVYQAMQGKRR